MTDERMGDQLLPAIAALPRGAGIIFRHYATPAPERRALFDAVRAFARRRRLTLILAGTPQQARAWKADGAHGRYFGVYSAPAHNLAEIRAADINGARLILLSPVFPTNSHPGAPTLGPTRFSALATQARARQARRPIIALGGITPARFKRLKASGVYGWAAIDGLTARAHQKRKAVPK